MADTRLVALGVVALLIVSLFVLVRPQGQPQPEIASNCPAIGQFVKNESALGGLGCQKEPFTRTSGNGGSIAFQSLAGTTFLKLTTFLGVFQNNLQPILPQIAFTPLTSAQDNNHICTDTTQTTPKMMGLKVNYTTRDTGQIQVSFHFSIDLPGTPGSTSTFQLTYGTGTAPACNAAATGTLTGDTHKLVAFSNSIITLQQFDIHAVRLTAFTTYWFDLTVTDTTDTKSWTYYDPEATIVEATNPLVGYWPFDERIGSSTYDLSGNGNTGTLQNSPTWVPQVQNQSPTCEFGTCLQFNGTLSQYVSIPSSVSLESPKTQITLSCWIYPTKSYSDSRYHTCLDKAYSGTFKWELSDLNNNMDFSLYNGVSQPECSGGSLSLNAWNLLTGTFDGTTLTCYLNGAQIATSNNAGFTFAASSGSVYIAQRDTQGDYFDGKIDDVHVYNVGLTAIQVLQLYTQGLEYHNIGSGTAPGDFLPYQTTLESFLPNQINASVSGTTIEWKSEWNNGAVLPNHDIYPIGAEDATGFYNGATIYHDFNGNWYCASSLNDAHSSTSISAITANVVHDLKIVFTTAGSQWDGYVDGNHVCTMSVNVPTGLLSPFIEMNNFDYRQIATLWGFGGSL